MDDKLKRRMLQAKQLIETKRYDDAVEILATIDHPKATEWLQRIEVLRGVQKRKAQKAVANELQTIILIVGAIALVIIAYLAWYNLSGRAERDRITKHILSVCLYAEEDGYICDDKTIIEAYPTQVAWCASIYGDTPIVDYSLYGFCLRDEGVPMDRR